jgi:hypothetical protein
MSATRSWTIQCDGCGENLGSADLGNETAAEARRQAKFDGAHVNLPGGRDICEGCWEAGVR